MREFEYLEREKEIHCCASLQREFAVYTVTALLLVAVPDHPSMIIR